MVRTTVTYTVPLKGTILDWESFEGDGSVGAGLIPNLALSWDTTGISVDEDKEIITYLKSIDIDLGTCVVDVVAHTDFHTLIDAEVRGSTIDQVASKHGITLLKIPDGETRPKKSLSFNVE